MLINRLALIAALLVAAGSIVAGCGSSSGSSSGSGSGSGGGGSAAGSGSTSGGSGSTGGGSGGGSQQGALAPDATSAATGDIPDTQNFLTFKDANFSMRYPEGWAQSKAGTSVTFKDKNNLVRVDVHKGAPPTVASVTAELAKLKASNPSLSAPAPKQFSVKGTPAIKVTYTTKSAPNQVTGKRVTLMVDRYELSKGGKVAVVDLGTPTGVDNVDAYRMMIESFKWL